MSDGERRLAAIMFTDIVGYTALSQKNEALAMQLLEEHRKIVRPFFSRHNGKEVKTIGDAFLVEFASALEAVRCGFDIQQSIHETNLDRPEGKRILLRVGVHVGDVIHSQNDVYGDAVNVASRIEPLAPPGGICVSEQVYANVRNKFEFPLVSLGQKDLKNVQFPVEVYKVVMPWEQSLTSDAATYPANRIAILPFTSFSLDPNDGFFADGMTEEIISTVSGISGLSVISRTSVMGYKGTTKKVEEIGRELKVGSVLEGSFRKAGNRIRVTTQLIDVAGDKHLWAQNYDRDLDDVFAVQSDVAKQVADVLRVKILSPERERIEKKPTESTTAYTLYLKGRYLWSRRGGSTGIEDVKKAMECFEQAIKEDPSFALGYVGVADCCMKLPEWGFDSVANMEKCRTMLARALEFDRDLAEAHATKGSLLMHEYNFKQAEEEFRKAIELKPGYPSAHHWYFLLLLVQQRWDEALEQAEEAVRLDPLFNVINYIHAWYYMERRDYAKALELLKRTDALEHTFPAAHSGMATMYGKMKMFDDMRRENAIWVGLVRDARPLASIVGDISMAQSEGDRETVRRLLPELEAHLQESGASAFAVASYHFYLGELDEGFLWLEKSYAKKEFDVCMINLDENLAGARNDPRYLDLLKRIGLE